MYKIEENPLIFRGVCVCVVCGVLCVCAYVLDF